jgi:uncharacterized protein (DUF169 family)
MTKESAIAEAAGFTTEPVAIVWTDTKPEGALEFKPGVWGCVMWMYARVAKDKKTAVFTRETIGCIGAALGLGFGRPFERHSAKTEEGFCSFLSNGIEGAEDKAAYTAIAESGRDERNRKVLAEGERLMKDPSVVKTFLKALPEYDIREQYIVMKPLAQVRDDETVKSVIFLADADQISALSILANYETGTIKERVTIATGASGCQAIGACTYTEGERSRPRAVIGLTDITARRNVRKMLGKDKLTFSVPYSMFLEMEKNVPGSFLESDDWKELIALE